MVMAVPAVDRSSDRPAYKQVADRIRERIDADEFQVGDRLPSETQLMREFDVSRSTVRGGLELLKNEGRVEAIRGRGVYVREPRTTRRIISRDPRAMLRVSRSRDRVQSFLESQGIEFRQVIDSLPRDVAAPLRVADAFGIDAATLVFVRPRVLQLRSPDEPTWTTVKIADSYYPLDVVAPHMRQLESSGRRGLHGGIVDAGHPITRIEEQTCFRMPDPVEDARLQTGRGVPVIDQFRIVFSGDRPVECLVAISAADRYELEYRIPVE